MTARTIPDRSAIPPNHQWDLTPLFADDAEWQPLFDQLTSELPGYARYQGHLGDSAEALAAAVTFDLDLSRRIERLYTYAHLKNDEDKSNQAYLAMYQRAVSLYSRASELSSFMRPEIMAIPAETMQTYLTSEALADYRFYLEKILRHRPHTLDGPMEEMLAMSREMAQTASQVFGQLDNVDLSFGTINDGTNGETELSHGNFTTFLQHPDRDIRRKAFFQYYAAYENHQNTIAAALAGTVKADLFYARSRKHATCREAALFGDDIPLAVYDNLLETVKAHQDPLFTYLDFRRDALGLDELHFYDTYVPIVRDIAFDMPYEEAVATCLEALAPLGSDYTEVLRKGLTGGLGRPLRKPGQTQRSLFFRLLRFTALYPVELRTRQHQQPLHPDPRSRPFHAFLPVLPAPALCLPRLYHLRGGSGLDLQRNLAECPFAEALPR